MVREPIATLPNAAAGVGPRVREGLTANKIANKETDENYVRRRGRAVLAPSYGV
jgi:hypothetical protein